jgi:hypothetical protein
MLTNLLVWFHSVLFELVCLVQFGLIAFGLFGLVPFGFVWLGLTSFGLVPFGESRYYSQFVCLVSGSSQFVW